MSLFSTNAEVLDVGNIYLWVVPVSFGLEGVVMVINAAFNGIGRPLPAVMISVSRMVLLTIPVAYLLSLVWGVTGIFIGVSLANILSGVFAWVWFKRLCDERSRPLGHAGDARVR